MADRVIERGAIQEFRKLLCANTCKDGKKRVGARNECKGCYYAGDKWARRPIRELIEIHERD